MPPPPASRGGRQVIPRPDVWRLGAPAPWRDGRAPASVADVVDVVTGHEPARVPPFPGARDSAVLVLLHGGPDGPEVLFTKRAAHLRNHRGEISFPGGRTEPGETPPAAALREAWEEVAVPAEVVTVHGELDHLATVVSRSYIVPVVGSVAARPPLTPHPGEVERAMWVPLAELAHPEAYREEWWGSPPLERAVHFFELEGETVWGATARVLHQLLRLAYGPPATRTTP